MNARVFESLEAEIADGGDEAAIFARMLALAPPDTALSRYCATRAYADAAILIHRALVPAHGYQLGETASRRGIASSWRQGDAHARTFEAATPGLALLRATAHAAASHLRDRTRAACTMCGGLGWFITREGRKRICLHGDVG